MYRSLNDHDHKRPSKDFHENLFYSACADIVGEPNGVVLHKGTPIAKGPMVAFWCEWDKKVKASNHATDYHRKVITEMESFLSA